MKRTHFVAAFLLLFRVSLIGAVLLPPFSSWAMPPPERSAALRRGVNITGWFRFPTSRDPAALRVWLSDPAMADLRRAGFTFVRLAIDPAIIDGAALRQVLLDQVRRLQRNGLAVVLSPHPVNWAMDTDPAYRARLVAFWRDLAPALRDLPQTLTFPEVMNEPVFRDDAGVWWQLQDELLATIRAALPDATIILTGQDWGSIAGLLSLTPVADGNVIYSFHFYDPAELTSLAAYHPGLDRQALARLPFPVSGPTDCQPAADATRDPATRDLVAFYCATGWDANRIRARIDDAADWARRHGVTLLAGEFGASVTLNSSARLAWLRLARESCEADGIDWALWGYDDVMGFDVKRPPGDRPRLNQQVLRALGLRTP